MIALTEFRARPGIALCAELRDRGWPQVESTNPTGNVNGIAVFSRTPMRRTRPCPAPSGNQVRWLDVDLPEYGFGVGVLHIMAAGSKPPKPREGPLLGHSARRGRSPVPRALPVRGRLEYRRASGGREGEVPHCKSSGTNSERAVWDEECRLLRHRADKR